MLKSIYAIRKAVKNWRKSKPIMTASKDLLEQVLQTPEQQHYLSKLVGFEYTIFWVSQLLSFILLDQLLKEDQTTRR